MSSYHHPDPINEAERILLMGAAFSMSKLIQRHKNLWEKQWETDIIIEGNPSDQKDIRFMLYHVYSFINPAVNYGLSPMGLSGLGYNGHIFWDMDLWMYPGILALDSKLARPLIEYRFDRLDQAINNAFINGYQGAMYPWESSQDGT
jgi:trehalose/maltose hydrolase-like predicted phosphorylase